MNAWIKAVQGMALGTPMLLMLLGTHFYFTIRLRFIQKKIPQGIYMSFSKNGQGEGNISTLFCARNLACRNDWGREILSESLRQLQSEGRGRFSGVG